MKKLTIALGLFIGLESLNLTACGISLTQSNGSAFNLDVASFADCSGTRALVSLPGQAVTTNVALAEFAINALRRQGPIGLDQLWDAHAQTIRQHSAGPLPANDDPAAWERLRTALDKVSGQRDAYMSHLFW
jgi:hypothetical protein